MKIRNPTLDDPNNTNFQSYARVVSAANAANLSTWLFLIAKILLCASLCRMRLFTILLLLSPALFCSCSEKDDFNWDAMDAISERKSARGDFNIGVLFHNGEDLAQDYVKAAEFFRKSAEWGLPDAQHWLGVMYHYGRGVTEDDTEAAKWFRKAAEQGFTDAQYMLGRLYTNGVGVAEDDVLAYMWWNLAAAQGHEAAKENKGIVSKRMTREQIAEAQKLSREWMANRSE